MPDNRKRWPDRLAEIKAFAEEHGYNALTGSDAHWLIVTVERDRVLFERMLRTDEAVRKAWSRQIRGRLA